MTDFELLMSVLENAWGQSRVLSRCGKFITQVGALLHSRCFPFTPSNASRGLCHAVSLIVTDGVRGRSRLGHVTGGGFEEPCPSRLVVSFCP